MNKRKYLIMMALTVITLSLSGCGSQEEASADEAPSLTEDNQVTANATSGEQAEEAETNDDVQDSEAKAETNTTEDAEELEVEVIPDEPEVEMVDFETWAKQEGNDEPCLVVWNEELGIQEVIPPFQEKQEIRGINEGDKFAIPYNEKIRAVMVNDEDVTPPLVDYREVSVMTGGQIVIIFENEQGELQTINYLF